MVETIQQKLHVCRSDPTEKMTGEHEMASIITKIKADHKMNRHEYANRNGIIY